MATGRGCRLLVLALPALIICGIIAVDANNNGAGKIQKGNVKEIGIHHYIAWRMAPKEKVLDGFKCPVRSERPRLSLAWYGLEDVQKKFANFKSCSDLAQNDTGSWQDYTERIRSALINCVGIRNDIHSFFLDYSVKKKDRVLFQALVMHISIYRVKSRCSGYFASHVSKIRTGCLGMRTRTDMNIILWDNMKHHEIWPARTEGQEKNSPSVTWNKNW